MNGPWQKLMVKSYSHSYQPSRESAAENVMKTLKPRSNVLKAQESQEHQMKKQSTLYQQHESPADPQSLHASGSSLEVLDKAQNAQKFIGTCMVTPEQIHQESGNVIYLLAILTYLSPGKCFLCLFTLFFFACLANDTSFSYLWTSQGVGLSFLIPLPNPQGISRLGISYTFVPWEVFWWININTRIFSQYCIHKEIPRKKKKREDPWSKKVVTCSL